MRDFDTGRRFEDAAYAQRHLNNGYVIYDGKPYYISCLEGFKYRLYEIRSEKGLVFKEINVQNDPLLELTSPVLGYMNTHNGDAMYIVRRPSRQWKQSLDETQCSHFSANSRTWGFCAPGQFMVKSFADMINGKYPKFEDIEKGMRANPFVLNKAISKDFAISGKQAKFELLCKAEVLGTYFQQTRQFALKPEFLTPTMKDHLKQLGLRIA